MRSASAASSGSSVSTAKPSSTSTWSPGGRPGRTADTPRAPGRRPRRAPSWEPVLLEDLADHSSRSEAHQRVSTRRRISAAESSTARATGSVSPSPVEKSPPSIPYTRSECGSRSVARASSTTSARLNVWVPFARNGAGIGSSEASSRWTVRPRRQPPRGHDPHRRPPTRPARRSARPPAPRSARRRRRVGGPAGPPPVPRRRRAGTGSRSRSP